MTDTSSPTPGPMEQGQQQTCKACGRPDKFDFHVPDEVWLSVVPDALCSRVVCLSCFDGFARERRVNYATRLSELWFAGEAATFEFQIRVVGVASQQDAERAADRALIAQLTEALETVPRCWLHSRRGGPIKDCPACDRDAALAAAKAAQP